MKQNETSLTTFARNTFILFNFLKILSHVRMSLYYSLLVFLSLSSSIFLPYFLIFFFSRRELWSYQASPMIARIAEI